MRICDRDLETEIRGEGAGLRAPGDVLERCSCGRELIDDDVGWEWNVRAGAGGIGPSDGPGNRGRNATMIVS